MRQDSKSLLQKLLSPLQLAFAEFEISGLILLAVTILALVLANSQIGEAFLHFWHTKLVIVAGDFKLPFDLHFLINDVLMTFFFIVVGGEIKREVIEGALSSKEKAILPIIAALGGMLFPALFFTAFNFGKPTSGGWGIPTATDIAFSLTIISLLGKRVPFSLKIFLAALAIADDLGAIVVIAIFYSNSLNLYYLAGGFVVIGGLFALNKAGSTNLFFFSALGIMLWYFFLMAGIHPTIAGVIFAMCVPFRLDNYETIFANQLKSVQDCVSALGDKTVTDKLVRGELIGKIRQESHKMEAPLHNVLHFLHPISNYCIMPLFAFANAGVIINTSAFASLGSPVSLGIITGLMLGKSTGITLTSWIAVKLKLAQIPEDVNWKYIYGMAWVAGIGFTMSMFVTQLAFTDQSIIDTSKLAIIIASTLSGIIGYTYLKLLTKVNAN